MSETRLGRYLPGRPNTRNFGNGTLDFGLGRCLVAAKTVLAGPTTATNSGGQARAQRRNVRRGSERAACAEGPARRSSCRWRESAHRHPSRLPELRVDNARSLGHVEGIEPPHVPREPCLVLLAMARTPPSPPAWTRRRMRGPPESGASSDGESVAGKGEPVPWSRAWTDYARRRRLRNAGVLGMGSTDRALTWLGRRPARARRRSSRPSRLPLRNGRPQQRRSPPEPSRSG
jgi:hypothetical protein